MEKGLPEMREKGTDIFTRGAPALLLFHAAGIRKTTPKISSRPHYGLLAAHSLAWSQPIGLIPPAVERNKDLRRLFRSRRK